MISQAKIDQVRAAADILEVVGEYVQMKKRGSNWFGLSPFHEEKTPSFSVAPHKDIFKDFSTGKGGDVFRFLMELEGMSYVEAIRHLATKYGIDLEEREQTDEEKEVQSERESLQVAMKFAAEWYAKNLSEHPEGKSVGESYLRERGINQKSRETFLIGYSLNTWDAFHLAAKEQQYQEDILQKAGLIQTSKTGNWIDRFRGRLMFPIRDPAGRVVGFGARALKADDAPKYLNSSETPLYNKSKILYGIHEGKQAIRNQDLCYLVEGYTDVISLHQGGIENVVAASGTALTKDQIKLIKRYTKNVVALFDGDRAGLAAALRGVDLLLEEGMSVQAVVLPDGEDPDSTIKNLGPEGFQKYLSEHRRDAIAFQTEIALESVKGDPMKKAALIGEIVKTIGKVQDPIARALYFRESAERLGVDEGLLYAQHNKAKIRERNDQSRRDEAAYDLPEPPVEFDRSQEFELDTEDFPQERELLRLLVRYAHETLGDETVVQFVFAELDEEVEFVDPRYASLISLYRQGVNTGEWPNIDAWLHDDSDEERRQLLIELSSETRTVSPGWAKHGIHPRSEAENLNKVVRKAVLHVKQGVVVRRLREAEAALQQAEASGEEATLAEAMSHYLMLKRIQAAIAADKDLGTVVNP